MSDRNSYIGASLWELDTPVLVLDVDVLDRNIRRLADFFQQHQVHWRPHAKAHKTPAIAHREIEAGAIGITCAKLSEAEVLSSSGIRDILIANQVVGAEKIRRLVHLNRVSNVMVCVDNLANVEELAAEAARNGVDLPVLVEVDMQTMRCGVPPGQPSLQLARQVASKRSLTLAGLMGWEGNILYIPDIELRRREGVRLLGQIVQTKALIQKELGIAVPIVSVGGTGTYKIAAQCEGITEVQAGGGVLMDLCYRQQGVEDLDYALTVLTTVISRPTADRLVVDAGFKALNIPPGVPNPSVRGSPEVEYVRLDAEHGVLRIPASAPPFAVGDKLEVIPGYADTTVFLHDRLFVLRDGVVVAEWEIAARGKLT